jgi:hypothetical protein
MGKRKGKRKRERILQPTGPGGILAQKAPARAGGRAFGPLGPAARGDGGGTALRRGPACQREGGGNGVNGTEGGTRSTGAGRRRAPRRFSAVGPVLRWGSGGGAWAVDGGHGVGRISPAGAYGGRSAARWRVPAAVLPSVRFPVTIEWGKWRVVTVRVWRSSWHNLIERKIAREGEGSSPER